MPEFKQDTGCQTHQVCSGNLVPHLREHYGLRAGQITAVGHWRRDACLLEMADRGFIFKSDATGGFPSLRGNLGLLLELCGLAMQAVA